MTAGGWAGAARAGVAVAGLVVAVLGSAGCQGRARPAAPPAKTFRLCLEASPRLNWYEGRAHALALRLFRLTGSDAFERADARGLAADPHPLPGALGSPLERTISPGTTLSVDVPRKPPPAFVGLVAAYAAGPRKLLLPVSEPSDAPSGCIHLGADAIGGP
jgi:type VI secretion system VasD/TssJ family lipoprotein